MPNYSAYGSHLMCPLRVYHQGGLDTYCGFYALLNLINFLYFSQNHHADEPGDFIGATNDEGFGNFDGLVGNDAFSRIFFTLRVPFGGKGLDAPALCRALSVALNHFNFNAQPKTEENLKIGIKAEEQKNFWFRIGAQTPFVSPNSPNHALGIAAVMEDGNDDLLHWVVLVGKDHLNGTRIGCEKGWSGIVLDSDRGYKFWKCIVQGGHPRLQIQIQRNGRVEKKRIHWIYSFISVFEV